MKPNSCLSILLGVVVSVAFLGGCESKTQPGPTLTPTVTPAVTPAVTPSQPAATTPPTTPPTITTTTPGQPKPTDAAVMTKPLEAAGETATKTVSKPPDVQADVEPATAKPVVGDERIVMTTGEGIIILGLYEKEAPTHVQNFKTLVRNGFYDGSSFHRVVEKFIAQGGKLPQGKAAPVQGAPSESKLKHARGSLAMARPAGRVPAAASDPTEFYICYDSAPELDTRGNTVFGTVLQGLPIVNTFQKQEIGTLKGSGAGFLEADKQTKILKAEVVPANGVAQAIRSGRTLFLSHKTQMAATTPKTTFQPKAGDEYAVLTLDIGDVVIDLFEEDAPKHAENFKKHVKSGYYDGLSFHRVIPGFMAQGGDPQGTGMGGPGYTIEAEIKRKHLRGSLAAARTGRGNPEKRSSGSQFYICFRDTAHLDGAYTVYGQVVKGMDVVDKIQRGQPPNFPMERRTKILKAELVPASQVK